jgi:tetratricopeptide (TPR) repeat protein
VVESGYATRDVARIAGVGQGLVRALVRGGVLTPRKGPRGAWLFSMPDVVLLRAAGELRGKLPARRLQQALVKLRAQLPAGRSLSSVRISSDGKRLVASDGDLAWEPATGQGLLAFDVAEVAREIAPLARAQVRAATSPGRALTAAQFYELGCDLEASSPREARKAYEKALLLDARHADAQVNLGRLLHEAGDAAAAADHYRAALEAARDVATVATAAFNLGVALEDAGDPAGARDAYQRALAVEPDHGDAHFNLARLLELVGDRAGAVRHMREYRNLERG